MVAVKDEREIWDRELTSYTLRKCPKLPEQHEKQGMTASRHTSGGPTAVETKGPVAVAMGGFVGRAVNLSFIHPVPSGH